MKENTFKKSILYINKEDILDKFLWLMKEFTSNKSEPKTLYCYANDLDDVVEVLNKNQIVIEVSPHEHNIPHELILE